MFDKDNKKSYNSQNYNHLKAHKKNRILYKSRNFSFFYCRGLANSEILSTFAPQFCEIILIIITMYLDQDKKKEIFGTYGKSNTDTGSPEAQIALFSYRIAHLTEHLKVNKKDHTTQRALKMLVGKRRRLLDYLIRTDINRYRAIIAKKELGIRK